MSYCDIQPDFYSWAEPVARKEHKCCECGTPIIKGEKHFSATGKWDFGIETYRQHLDCCSACMFVRDQFNDGECIGFGELLEFFCDSRPLPKDGGKCSQFRKMVAAVLRRQRKAKGAKK